MSNDQLEQLKQEVMDAFRATTKPELKPGVDTGCCDEHEEFFAAYRKLNWQEFLAGLPEEQFDPFEFGSLVPALFHYFFPGILIYFIESIQKNTALYKFDDWDCVLIPLDSSRDNFIETKLPYFNEAQRQVTCAVLECFNAYHLQQKGYKSQEVEAALELVWR